MKNTTVHFTIDLRTWAEIDRLYHKTKAKLPVAEQIGFSKAEFQRRTLLSALNINIEQTASHAQD